MPLWNCLPVVLIAMAALLMDQSMILPRDRIYVQVLLWLAASLQPTPGTSAVAINSHHDDHDWMIRFMVHVIFLANLLQHASWVQPFQRRYHHQKHAKEYLRIVGPSAWISLLYLCLAWPSPSSETSITEYQEHETICIQRGWWVFGMSWLVLAMYTWQTIRTNIIMMSRQSDANMTGMPIAGHDRRMLHQPLDLRTWYEWSPSQVGAWILSLAAHGGDEAESARSVVVAEDSDQGTKRPHDWQQVVDLLAPEQMAGAELPSFTVQDLRCIMGIPYGTASRLVREIQRLVAKYPAPSSLQLHYSSRVTAPTTSDYDEKKEHASETSWLPRYFEDYYDDYRPHDKERSHVSDGREYGYDDADERISEQQHQQAREIMQKRFGMEMPIMATTRMTRPENHNDRPTQPFDRHEPFESAAQAQQAQQEQVSSILKELPPQLLESMPRHIQEICHRNPELLRQVLAMKQPPQPPPISTPPLPNSDRNNLLFPHHHEVSDTKPPATTLPQHPRVHVQHDYHSQVHTPAVVHQMYDDDDEDGERTELLRKRRVDFHLYRATS